ncbi:P-loop containing nucleoside triphosphate hydrolase protein [Jimgerdemannia flammicorona]|uniref:P-loop containing nucleoside triphosphate hydrolase protein n=1 Tax=Jimgerdemannia flammicorona TaxID=994334 RepID=A0A433DGS9_9FUNG|nr:P-loop containing nucleoside triphosphate hydrolase protein [Jimgerdemannia flammicorona]
MEERPFGNPITNPNEVEITVRRAQKAVLNPKQDQQIYESYLFGTKSYINDAATNLLKFSKNIICIEIRGEDTLNLSLIDLPGIIRHTESKEERHLVTIIEELVQQYIANENSIVIATIACKDDIENQAIVSMAREIDPEGQRTLGVLTKPDTIEKGCHEMWVKIFKGEAHQLRLGYFLVKNPTKAELDKGISFEHARKTEMDFFSRSPWTSLSKKRMGVDNLATTLSDILLSAIRTKIPDIKQDVTSLLDKCRENLRALPDPPNLDPHLEACCLINKFVNRLQSWIDADKDSRIWQSAVETFAKFKKDIRNVGPRFGLKSGNEEGVTSRIELAELGFAYKKRKISIQDVERIYAIIDDPHDDGSAILDDGYTIVTEDQIEDLLHRSRGRQLPAGGFIPYQTLRTIVERFHGKWMVPTMECLSAVATTFATELEIAVEEVFGKYPDVAGIIW